MERQVVVVPVFNEPQDPRLRQQRLVRIELHVEALAAFHLHADERLRRDGSLRWRVGLAFLRVDRRPFPGPRSDGVGRGGRDCRIDVAQQGHQDACLGAVAEFGEPRDQRKPDVSRRQAPIGCRPCERFRDGGNQARGGNRPSQLNRRGANDLVRPRRHVASDSAIPPVQRADEDRVAVRLQEPAERRQHHLDDIVVRVRGEPGQRIRIVHGGRRTGGIHAHLPDVVHRERRHRDRGPLARSLRERDKGMGFALPRPDCRRGS